MVNYKDIEYIMLKLDGKSKSMLIRLTQQLFGNMFQKIYCDHITLAYGQDQVSQFDQHLFDKKIKIDVNTIIYDRNAAAISIDRNDVLQYGVNNKYPHITLATSSSTKPVYSNALMQNFAEGSSAVHQYMLDEFITLACTIVPHIYQNKYMI